MMFYELKSAQGGDTGRRPAGPDQVLRHQLHQALALHCRRRLLRQPGYLTAPDRRPVGRHERDWQLPRPAMALALPAVVSRRAVQQLRERRHLGRLPHRHRHHPATARPLHPGPAGHPTAGPGAPAHLAPRLEPARNGPAASPAAQAAPSPQERPRHNGGCQQGSSGPLGSGPDDLVFSLARWQRTLVLLPGRPRRCQRPGG